MARVSRILILAACVVGSLPTRTVRAAEAEKTIVFYDPDSNYAALPRIVESLNAYFAQALAGYTVHVTADAAAVRQSIESSQCAYAILASQYVAAAKSLGLTPLLVPQSKGSVYYRKILVDNGQGTAGDLRGKRLAAATGDLRSGASRRIFDLLRGAGWLVDGTVFLGTTKDLDALLALTFGEADAALVTSFSVDTLKEVSPDAAASLRDMWTSGKILRPLLVAVKAYEDPARRSDMVKAFNNLPNVPAGRQAMEALAYDGWVPYTADLAAEAKQ